MNRFLTTVLILSLAAGTAVAQRYSGGLGTESKPFQISSREDLEMLAETVNSGRSYADTCFLLTTDLEGVTTIIGTLDRPFSGVFDGGGHKITVDITVVHAMNDSTDIGLFGHINSGVIRNLGVAGQITARGEDEFTRFFWTLGGICGRVSGNALIDNCYNEAALYTRGIVGYSLNGLSPDHDYQQSKEAGGICGAARAGVVISNCYNAGIIDGTYYAGGIAGHAYNASIIDCRNISGRFDDCYHIAGICGHAYAGSLISGCSNTADISCRSTLGGICQQLNASDIINCYNTGNLSATDGADGIVCSMGRSETYGGPSTVSHCYNTGNLSGDRVGGICGGTADNTVSHCYNTGKISAIDRAGGICASAGGTAPNSGDQPYYVFVGIVTDCYNTGDISVDSREYVSGVGGIVGYAAAENIINCYNSGNISVTHSSATYESVAFVGGIVGMGGGRITNCVVACDSIYSKRDTTESLYTARISGPISASDKKDWMIIENCHAKASMKFNGKIISSQDATGKHGKDLANPDEILSAIEAMKRDTCLTYGEVVDRTAESPAIIFQSSSNPEIAEITDGVLIARKTGETAVTANFAWSEEDYFQMSFPKTVGKRDLHIAAGEYSRAYGDPNPAFTLAYFGFVAGDGEQSLDELPSISCSAGETSPVGSYEVVLSGGSDNNYTFVLESGVLQITDRQTGIKDLTTAGNDKPVIYDLSGRKVSPTALQKGVYILNQGTKTVKINHH